MGPDLRTAVHAFATSLQALDLCPPLSTSLLGKISSPRMSSSKTSSHHHAVEILRVVV